MYVISIPIVCMLYLYLKLLYVRQNVYVFLMQTHLYKVLFYKLRKINVIKVYEYFVVNSVLYWVFYWWSWFNRCDIFPWIFRYILHLRKIIFETESLSCTPLTRGLIPGTTYIPPITTEYASKPSLPSPKKEILSSVRNIL